MVAFNFKAQFAGDVEDGSKSCTIRGDRKDGRKPCARGSGLQLYTGMRTKACRKLRDAVCSSVDRIEIHGDGAVGVAGRVLRIDEASDLARADGFETRADFLRFFEETHGLPFRGWLIKWGVG